MPKRRKVSARSKGSLRERSAMRIPRQVKECIKGRTVDISTASPYFKKSWNIYRPLVARDALETRRNRYKLSKAFFKHFIACLAQELSPTLERYNLNAGDLVASALSYTAYDVGRAARGQIDVSEYINEMPLWPKRGPVPDFLTPPLQTLPPRPISEAWRRLGDLPIPPPEVVTLEEPVSGKKWQQPQDVLSDRPRISVILAYNENKEALPQLTIEIKGEPVCLLMRANSPPQGFRNRADRCQ